jgi:hypothetical protein
VLEEPSVTNQSGGGAEPKEEDEEVWSGRAAVRSLRSTSREAHSGAARMHGVSPLSKI